MVAWAGGALRLILLLPWAGALVAATAVPAADVDVTAGALVAAPWRLAMLENALAAAYGYTAVSTHSTSPT